MEAHIVRGSRMPPEVGSDGSVTNRAAAPRAAYDRAVTTAVRSGQRPMSVEAVSRGVAGFEVGLRCLLAAVDRGDAASIAGWFEMGHFADSGTAGLAVPAVLQLDDPVAGGGAGD